jgi:integrase
MFRHHITAWAVKFDSVRDITQGDIFDLFNSKPAELSNGMHNSVYDAIKAWFKHMHRVERIVEYNVTWGIRQPRPPSERTRWLTDDEIRWFWSACTAEGYPHGNFMKLLFLTAQRPSEVREMPLSELASYHDRQEWHLGKERTKPRREHVIPISDFAAELVDGLLKRRNKNYLFVKRRERPPGNCCKPRIRVARLMEAYRAQERLRQGLDPNEGSIPPWDLRDLRRTAATILARRKHALHVIEGPQPRQCSYRDGSHCRRGDNPGLCEVRIPG